MGDAVEGDAYPLERKASTAWTAMSGGPVVLTRTCSPGSSSVTGSNSARTRSSSDSPASEIEGPAARARSRARRVASSATASTNTKRRPQTAAADGHVLPPMNDILVSDPALLVGDTTNPTYAELMAATDLTGRLQSYLASEDNFRIIRDLERQNLVVPVVGDFAGDKAIIGIGRYVREHAALVNTFYVSNVERYLFEQGDRGKQFYANAASLPIDASSIFVRAVTSDISRRLGIPIPDSTAKWRTFLYGLQESVNGVTTGRIQNYAQLFEVGRR